MASASDHQVSWMSNDLVKVQQVEGGWTARCRAASAQAPTKKEALKRLKEQLVKLDKGLFEEGDFVEKPDGSLRYVAAELPDPPD
ncbi:MAG: hypothetical protein J4F98_05845 [Acidobacteria bacterium]|nr:hypothetical protein [Acidobacteriota bacterium]